MGILSSATDFAEDRLSLDHHCQANRPGVFFSEMTLHHSGRALSPGCC